MKRDLTEDLEIMWKGRDGDDIDGTLEAFDRILEEAAEPDLPVILEVLERPELGFWIRELLMQPVVSLGGASYLPMAFEALKMNEEEDHDSDSLVGHLMEFVEWNKKESKVVLESILVDQESPFHEDALWLMEYCE